MLGSLSSVHRISYEHAVRERGVVLCPLCSDDVTVSWPWFEIDSAGKCRCTQTVFAGCFALQLADQLCTIIDQYDNEDFDLGIKQFMIEQAIQQVRLISASKYTQSVCSILTSQAVGVLQIMSAPIKYM